MKPASTLFSENPDFHDWMSEQDVSVGFAAQGANEFVLLGRHDDGSPSIFARQIDSCKKLCGDGTTIWMSTRNHLWRFENCLGRSSTAFGCDRMYLPKLGIATGEIGVQDIVVETHGRVVIASSMNSCLATINESNCVVPFWRPPLNSSLFDVDRCHLSGLALEDGYSKYVTAFDTKRTDLGRRRSFNHGCVIDIQSNEIVATELSMPHSPFIYKGLLWLINSGTGHLGYVDFATGHFHDVLGFQGSLEGLAFHGNYAIVGLSRSRQHTVSNKSNGDNDLSKSNDVERCEIQAIDMQGGVVTGRFTVPEGICKINDVVILPGVTLPGVVRPQAVGFDLNLQDEWFRFSSNESLKKIDAN